jgi:restriction endonuclease S subunit
MQYSFSELIEEVNEKNTSLKYGIEDIVGVTIEKGIIPTIANLSQTALDKFYIVKPGTFIYNPRTHGVRIGMGYNDTECTYITSWNNVAFKVKEEAKQIVNPMYLWMYFLRSEWDRETNYYAMGSSTIVFLWSTFQKLKIELPSIEKQNIIVRQYEVLQNRIQLKKQINDNLAATLDALFSELYGQLNDDDSVSLDTVCSLASSKRVFADDYSDMGVPFYRGKEITLKQAGQPIIEPLYIEKEHFTSLKEKYGIPMKGDILITAVGTIGNSYLVRDEEFYFKDGNIIWLKDFKGNLNYYVYDFMQTKIFKQMLDGICIGSTQTALTIVALSNLQIKIPDSRLLNEYTKQSMVVRTQIELNTDEISHLYELQAILLAELSR